MVGYRTVRKLLSLGYLVALMLALPDVSTGWVQAPTSPSTKSVSPAEKGPAIGETIPAFAAYDQHGKRQSLSTLTGANGLVLLFVRSADW